jgi:hypothetical protein
VADGPQCPWPGPLSGFYWSATTSGHVIYESRLELACLLLADFDPDVTAIAAQPFLLRAQAGGRVRRHVPDFLLSCADGTVRVVNVKSAARLADPAVAEALAWPSGAAQLACWLSLIWATKFLTAGKARSGRSRKMV